MAAPDFAEQTKALDATLTSIEKVLDLDAVRKEIGELREEVGDPQLWDDQANAQRVTSRLSTLQAEVERVTGLRSRLDDVGLMHEMALEEADAEATAEGAEHDGSEKSHGANGPTQSPEFRRKSV